MSARHEYDISEFYLQEGKTTHEYFATPKQDREKVVEEFYSRKGHSVIKMNYGSATSTLLDSSEVPKAILEDINDRMERKFEFSMDDSFMGGNTIGIFNQIGVPDFLTFNQKSKDFDYCFVEAKRDGDPLRQSQVKWFTIHHCLPSKIAYVESASKHTYISLD